VIERRIDISWFLIWFLWWFCLIVEEKEIEEIEEKE